MNKSEEQFPQADSHKGVPSIREIWGLKGVPDLKEMLDADK